MPIASLQLTRRAFAKALPFGVCAPVLAGGAAAAETAPTDERTITLVHPFVAGGVGYDLGHAMGERLRQLYQVTVMVEAKPGGNTVVGVTSVVKAPADGRTLLINSASILAIADSIYKRPAYSPTRDLVPVAFVAKVPLVLVVNSALPVDSLDTLVAHAKATPGGLTYSSTGFGGAQHLSGEHLKRRLGIEMTHVPFGGPLPALTAVVGGHVSLMFADFLNAVPMIQSGRVRAIAITTAAPAETSLAIPTLAQAGLADFDSDLRMGLFTPASTPAATISRLNAMMGAATSDADMRARFGRVGVQLLDNEGPKAAARTYLQEIARWTRLVQEAQLVGSQ